MIKIFYTGFADEAGQSIDVQIKATKELGWNYIELRNIDGVNITDISQEKFENVYNKLANEGIKVNCFGSAVANWAKDPRKDEDFQKSIDELNRAIPRMKKMGTKLIRGMSFAILKDVKDNHKLDKEILKKLKYLVDMCKDAKIIYGHENCMNYFSQSYNHMEQLINNIDSDAFKIIFDTGNPVFSDNRMGKQPYDKQKSWEVYKLLKDYIYHVHIKDCIYLNETQGIFPNAKYTFPGEGDGCVKKIIKDLLESGYNRGISIEPHMTIVFHKQNNNSNNKELNYKNYIEYGTRLMKLVSTIKDVI